MIKNKVLYTLFALVLLVVALLPNGVSADIGDDSCLGGKGNAPCGEQTNTTIGDNACNENSACYDLDNSIVEDYGCVGIDACAHSSYLTVGKYACNWNDACKNAENSHSTIGECGCGGQLLPDSIAGDTSNCDTGKSSPNVCEYIKKMTISHDACQDEKACEKAEESNIGPYSCDGLFSCWSLYNSTVGERSCQGIRACDGNNKNVQIGDNSCVKTGSSQAYGVCQGTNDMVIGSSSCIGDRGTCHDSVKSKVGDRSCQTISGQGEVENCYFLNGAEIGNDSCQDQFSCKYIGPRDRSVISGSDVWKVGNGSCQDNISCYNAGRGDLYDAQVEPQGVDIGDDSCNADQVCRDCEAGSVITPGTCNDLGNATEVGVLAGDYSGTTGTRAGNSRCRACFTELRQGDYSVEIAAGSSRRRHTRASVDTEQDSCSDLAHEVKEYVMQAIRSHPKFVQVLEKRDIPRKCARKFPSQVMGTSNLFDDGGCDVSIKLNVKMELNGAEGPVVAQMLKDVIVLPDGLALNDVMATKMNCKDGNGKSGKRGKGNKAAKKSSKAGGKPGKK